MDINITVYALQEQLQMPAHICTGPGTHRTADALKMVHNPDAARVKGSSAAIKTVVRHKHVALDKPPSGVAAVLPDTLCGQVTTLYKSHAHLI
jgi:hypothetical protein